MGDPQRSCPACGGQAGPMTETQLAGVTVDFCRACGGLWLDASEADRVVGPSLSLPAGAARGRNLPCPACAVRGGDARLEARRVEAAGVDLDTCPACDGTWLDAGELRALRRTRSAPAALPPMRPATGDGTPGPERQAVLVTLADEWRLTWKPRS